MPRCSPSPSTTGEYKSHNGFRTRIRIRQSSGFAHNRNTGRDPAVLKASLGIKLRHRTVLSNQQFLSIFR